MNKILPILLALAISQPAWAHDHHQMEMEQAQMPLSGDSVYNLADSWTDQNGRTIKLQALQGQPVILAMAYTHCAEMCPLTVEQMRKIEAQIAQQHLGPAHLVLVTFDSQRDTPARLKDYAAEHGLDSGQWTLLNGNADAVRQLAAMLGISYRQEPNGDFAHSYALTLLDRNGVIALQQTGLQPDHQDFTAKIAALKP